MVALRQERAKTDFVPSVGEALEGQRLGRYFLGLPTPKMGGDEAMLGMPVWFWIVAVVIGVTIVYSGNKNVLSRWR
ncbi:MAG: hypothetical protein PHX83_11840, partial [Acidobacteriia bacterium]|nr:hypothetical protein [Terriglobia bacterium]